MYTRNDVGFDLNRTFEANTLDSLKNDFAVPTLHLKNLFNPACSPDLGQPIKISTAPWGKK
jgi:hypothetical protein